MIHESIMNDCTSLQPLYLLTFQTQLLCFKYNQMWTSMIVNISRCLCKYIMLSRGQMHNKSWMNYILSDSITSQLFKLFLPVSMPCLHIKYNSLAELYIILKEDSSRRTS